MICLESRTSIARKRAIFVHGCFWHGHDCARGARAPKANAAYWAGKIARNCARDVRVRASLAALGWRALVIWECELRDEAAVRRRLRRFLRQP
jgi:DNA mismatch endonuclease (patch repair protein)